MMPYCPECDLHYEDEDRACPTCGYGVEGSVTEEIVADSVDTVKDENITNESPEANEAENGIPFHAEEEEVFQRANESQLGKGLIKPHAIEVSPDGFHFKYDEPSHPMVKQETITGNVVEFRVKSPDDIKVEQIEDLDEISHTETHLDNELEFSSQSTIIKKSTSTEPLSNEEFPGPFPTEVNSNESAPEPLLKNEPVIESQLQRDDAEPSFAIGANISGLPEPKILWEDNQTWLGVPGPTHYRLSELTLVALTPSGNEITHIEVSQIKKIKLKQNFLAKLCGVGNLIISAENQDQSELIIKGIKNPHEVYKILESLQYIGL